MYRQKIGGKARQTVYADRVTVAEINDWAKTKGYKVYASRVSAKIRAELMTAHPGRTHKTQKVVRTYPTAVSYGYYCRAAKGCAMLIEENEMDAIFDGWIRTAFAKATITRDVRVPGNDHANEIDQLERDLAELMLDVTADDFISRVTTTREQIMTLRASAEPAHTVATEISGPEIVTMWTTTTDAGERRGCC